MRTLNYCLLLALGLGVSTRAFAAAPPAIEPEPDAVADAAPSDEAADEPADEPAAAAATPDEPDHELAGSEDADTFAEADPLLAENDAVAADEDARPAADKSCLVEPVRVRRFGATGEVSLRLTDCAGRPNLSALPQLSRLAQPLAPASANANASADHDTAPSVQLNPELLVRMQCLVDRFAAHSVEIVSGYRPRARAGSRHHSADALDVRLDGVENLELSEFARTLDATGVGYYPNSTFVHIDVREGTAYWVDRSGPGERAKYIRSKAVASVAGVADRHDDHAPAIKAPAIKPTSDEIAAKKPEDTRAAAKAAPVADRLRDARMVDVPSETADETISGEEPVQVGRANAKTGDHERGERAERKIAAQPKRDTTVSDAVAMDPDLRAVYDRALEVMERSSAESDAADR